MDEHLKTVASQIEAQLAEVRECKAAVMDAINNDKEPGFLETLYRDAVAILNQLLDERKALAVALANKGASAAAEDIIELKNTLQLMNKKLEHRISASKRKPKRERSLRRTVLMKETKAAEGRAVDRSTEEPSPLQGQAARAAEDD
ncbi:hypothetical protein HDU80_011806 [Chytriomyces hyalinus]|nr:hypothetical protein HDU80_011806 [Chytriomyces hyalinus]